VGKRRLLQSEFKVAVGGITIPQDFLYSFAMRSFYSIRVDGNGGCVVKAGERVDKNEKGDIAFDASRIHHSSFAHHGILGIGGQQYRVVRCSGQRAGNP